MNHPDFLGLVHNTQERDRCAWHQAWNTAIIENRAAFEQFSASPAPSSHPPTPARSGEVIARVLGLVRNRAELEAQQSNEGFQATFNRLLNRAGVDLGGILSDADVLRDARTKFDERFQEGFGQWSPVFARSNAHILKLGEEWAMDYLLRNPTHGADETWAALERDYPGLFLSYVSALFVQDKAGLRSKYDSCG